MKIYITITLLMLVSCSLFAQDTTVSPNNTKQLVEHADKLVEESLLDSALVIYQDVKLTLLEKEDWKPYFYVVAEIGNILTRNADPNAISFLKEQVELSKIKIPEDEKQLGEMQAELAFAYRSNANYDQAKIAFEKAYNHFELAPAIDSSRLLFVYNGLGFTYGETGDWEQSEIFYNKTVAVCVARKEKNYINRTYLSSAYNGLGMLSKQLFQFDKAVEYQKKAIEIVADRVDLGIAYYNLASTYQENNQIDESLFYGHRAAEIFKEKYGETHFFVWRCIKSNAG